MKERPILFSAPMVKAILEGRKTETRRVMKSQSGFHLDGLGYPFIQTWDESEQLNWRRDLPSPYGRPGDRLWVRETWGHDAESLEHCRVSHEDAMGGSYGPYYRATEKLASSLRWRPSIHMPRWASRITLEVQEVRVERLHDITEEGAKAEGAERMHLDDLGQTFKTYRRGFESIWEKINGRESWESNPWVWVIKFARVAP